jgi:hypothetical protein
MLSRRLALLAALGSLLLVASGAPAAPEGECITIDDFTSAKIGELPPGWKLRKSAGKGIYSVQEENGVRFLRAVSRGLGIQAAREHDWDLTTHPVLAWAWRVREFPAGADERDSKTNDSALAVYAVFPHSPWSVKAVKYIWSARVPQDSHLTSSLGLTQVRVLRSGAAGTGPWVEERVNVLESYRRYFGEAEAPKPLGIAVLTDSDDTKSSAQGDYARFRVCRP